MEKRRLRILELRDGAKHLRKKIQRNAMLSVAESFELIGVALQGLLQEYFEETLSAYFLPGLQELEELEKKLAEMELQGGKQVDAMKEVDSALVSLEYLKAGKLRVTAVRDTKGQAQALFDQLEFRISGRCGLILQKIAAEKESKSCRQQKQMEEGGGAKLLRAETEPLPVIEPKLEESISLKLSRIGVPQAPTEIPEIQPETEPILEEVKTGPKTPRYGSQSIKQVKILAMQAWSTDPTSALSQTWLRISNSWLANNLSDDALDSWFKSPGVDWIESAIFEQHCGSVRDLPCALFSYRAIIDTRHLSLHQFQNKLKLGMDAHCIFEIKVEQVKE